MRPRVFVWLIVKFLGVYLIVNALKATVPLVVIVIERMIEIDLFNYRHPSKSLDALVDCFYPLLGRIGTILTIGIMLWFGLHCFRKGAWIVNRVYPRNAVYCADCGYEISCANDVQCKECGASIICGPGTKT